MISFFPNLNGVGGDLPNFRLGVPKDYTKIDHFKLYKNAN